MAGRYKAYPEYKDSGVEWLGHIPLNWKATKLKRYCKVTDGSHHSPKIESDGKPFVSVTDVGENFIDFYSAKKISQNNYLRLVNEGCKPEAGDILLTKDGTIGRACIVQNNMPDFVILSSLGLLTPTKKLTSEFLYYYLVSGINIAQMNSMIHGSALRRMTVGKIDDLAICFPLPQEQQKIASFLDHETAKIDTLIAKQEKLIELLKEKRQAVISHAVTKGLNPDVPMKDSGVEWLGEVPEHWNVAGFKKYLSSMVDYRGKTPNKVDSGKFLVTARNIKNGCIDYSLSQEYVSEQEYVSIMSRGLPAIGDVLFTTEAPLGEVAQVDREDIALAQRIVKFCGQKGVLNNTFLKYFMMSKPFQNSLNMFASGSTALGIKAERLVYLRLLIPPMREQIEITKHIEGVSQKIDQLQKQALVAIQLMKERRTALISAAVTGKIDVRDWQPPVQAEALEA